MICPICFHDTDSTNREEYPIVYTCTNCNLYRFTDFQSTIGETQVPYEEHGGEEYYQIVNEVRLKYEKDHGILPGFREVYKLRGNQVRYVIEIENLEGLDKEKVFTMTLPECVQVKVNWTKAEFDRYDIEVREALYKNGVPYGTNEFMIKWIEECEKFGMPLKDGVATPHVYEI